MSYVIEGEFRKRIEELLNHLEHNGYNDGYHIKESDVEKFWNIFVDARRDMIIILKEEYDAFFPKGYPSESMGNWAEPRVTAYRRWFKRWLK